MCRFQIKLIIYRPEKVDFQVLEIDLIKKPGKGLGLSVMSRKSDKGLYISDIVSIRVAFIKWRHCSSLYSIIYVSNLFARPLHVSNEARFRSWHPRSCRTHFSFVATKTTLKSLIPAERWICRRRREAHERRPVGVGERTDLGEIVSWGGWNRPENHRGTRLSQVAQVQSVPKIIFKTGETLQGIPTLAASSVR